jgi:CRISPR system Cascade subunit CasC
MLADMPDRNVNAACQVAHALSTHKVEMEMDFFTAVDDLKPDDSSGADMMGTVEFNSACFYRYALVDWDLLVRNLGGDEELARATLEAFLHASIEAIPTGKQNTFAAHNPPSFVMAAVREKGTPWSLANAFEAPVRANNEGLVKASIERLDQYWGRLSKMYGSPVRALAWAALDEAITCPNIGPAAETVGRLIETTMAAATPAGREVAP